MEPFLVEPVEFLSVQIVYPEAGLLVGRLRLGTPGISGVGGETNSVSVVYASGLFFS